MIKNKKMDELIATLAKNKEIDNVNVPLYNLLDLFKPNIKNINECIIIDNNNEIDIARINFSRLMKMHGDRTGYEATSNEIRINDLIPKAKFKEVLTLAIYTLEQWELLFRSEYPSRKFYLILSCDSEFVTIRFHQIWQEESPWLVDDIEKYNQAIAYKMLIQ